MTILFVKRNLLAGFHCLYEIGQLGFRIWKRSKLPFHIRNIRFESSIEFAVGPLNIRHPYIFAFPIKHNLAAVSIGIGNPPPRTHSIAMLLRGVHFHSNRAFVVFIEEILDGVNIMLAHITQSATIVIPVPPECSMYTMLTIGFIGRWA